MRFAAYRQDTVEGLAAAQGAGRFRGYAATNQVSRLVRKPPLWMKPGDICEVELEGIGVLRNPIADQAAAGA